MTQPTTGVVPPRSAWTRYAHGATLTLEIIAAVFLAVMIGAVLANVFMRYIFGQPIQATTEMVGYVYMPAVIFVGYVVSQARGQSIEADIIYSKLPRQVRREVRFLTSMVAAVACLGFGWFGLLEAIHAMSIGQTATASDVYIAPVYWLSPAAFGILAVLFVLDAIRAIRGKFEQPEPEALPAEGSEL